LASLLGTRRKIRRGAQLEPVAARLSELLSQDVYLPDDCIGDAAKSGHDLRPGQLALLENCDFTPKKSKTTNAFAHKLAQSCDVYVNDAFASCTVRTLRWRRCRAPCATGAWATCCETSSRR